MEKILRRMQSHLCRGEDCMLVTVLSRQGSAPRDVGAALLVNSKGSAEGTIGGGAIEAAAIRHAEMCLAQHCSAVRSYDLTGDVSMSCGGAVTLLFQYADEPLPLPEAGACGWLMIDVEPDGRQWSARFRPEAINPCGRTHFEGHTLFCPIGQAMRVWVFGAGHVAQALVPLLDRLDFRCVVLDDRAEYASTEHFPAAEFVHTVDLEQLSLNMSETDAACIMTRGHQSDYAVLRQVLHTNAGYIGLMGSSRKVAEIEARLRKEGFSREQIERVHMPIGTDISADTLMEIAVSIAGELILHRARYQGREKRRHVDDRLPLYQS